jgi:polygalacturonase
MEALQLIFNNWIMKGRREHILKATLWSLFIFATFGAFTQSVNILDFGAKADGSTINTRSIQAAIDKCNSNGGGQVVIPEGRFFSGTIFLKSGVNLHLLPGAILLGSTEHTDYPFLDIQYNTQFNAPNNGITPKFRALIYAENANNLGITGQGTINGNGADPNFHLGNDASSKESKQRPILLFMVNCRDITVEGLHLESSAYWMQNYLACENLHIKGLRIFNHSNYNNDGIDIDSKNVLIEDCIIDSDDDAICLKSHDKDRPCENVVVRNCVVRSICNGIKMGTGSAGGFRNIDISNITISKASKDLIRNWQRNLKFIEQPVTVLAGIAIENVDGGNTDNITVRNVFMTDVQTPIFIKLGNRALQNPGRLRNVKIDNITAASHSKMASSITGIPGYNVENVQLTNINISSMGQGTEQDGQINLPENEKGYPENRMFGFVLPASGLYLRHVEGIVVQNLTLQVRNKDYRPATVLNDVKQGSIGLKVIDPPGGNSTPIKLLNSQNIHFINTPK